MTWWDIKEGWSCLFVACGVGRCQRKWLLASVSLRRLTVSEENLSTTSLGDCNTHVCERVLWCAKQHCTPALSMRHSFTNVCTEHESVGMSHMCIRWTWWNVAPSANVHERALARTKWGEKCWFPHLLLILTSFYKCLNRAYLLSSMCGSAKSQMWEFITLVGNFI